jgi:hypothetical protein
VTDAGERKYPPFSILTYTGRIVTPFDMDPEQLCIADIAHALAMQPRFLGHTPVFYSVAQHCYEGALNLGAEDATEEAQLAFLLHAAEAYLCDMPSPLKHHPSMEAYRNSMEKLQWQIFTEFGVWQCARVAEAVLKNADLRMLSTEKRDVRFGQHAGEWPVEKTHPAYARRIVPFDRHKDAERQYLRLYRELVLRLNG